MKSRSLANQSLSLFFGQTTAFVVQLASSMILVRLISKSEYGHYQQFLLLGTTFVPVLGMGLTSSLYYFYPNFDRQKQSFLIQQTMLNQLLIGLLFFGVFVFFNFPALSWLNLENLHEHQLEIGAYIFFMLTSTIIDVIFTLEKAVSYNRFYFSIEKIVRLALLIGSVTLFSEPNVTIHALTLFSAIRLLFSIVYLSKYYRPFKLFSKEIFKEQWIYSLPFGASILLNLISRRIDKFIVSGYISEDEYAIYAVAFFSIPFLDKLFASINNVIMPEISKLSYAGDKRKVAEIWQKAVIKTASVTIPCVLFFSIMADELIQIMYTEAYKEVAQYYRIYIMLFLFSMFSYGLVLRGFKKTKYYIISEVIGAAVTVTCSFILIKNYGIYGAVYTALIGVSLPISIVLLIEKNILKLTWSNWIDWNKMIRIVLIAILCILPVILVKYWTSDMYIRMVISTSFFFPTIAYLQLRYDVFLYPRVVEKIREKIFGINNGKG